MFAANLHEPTFLLFMRHLHHQISHFVFIFMSSFNIMFVRQFCPSNVYLTIC
jgi:hypothetical protein